MRKTRRRVGAGTIVRTSRVNGVLLTFTRAVLELSRKDGISTAQAANRLADQACAQPHPMWGHRGRAILESLR